MRIYEHFSYTGSEQRWAVPPGVTSALFECWGAAGGMSSSFSRVGKPRETVGGSGPPNTYFYNSPTSEGQLGYSYSNNAGYVSGTRTTAEGEGYNVFVGGNGGPGFSTIRLTHSDNYTIGLRGGAAGWNGGAAGGQGAQVYQNLYNQSDPTVKYEQGSAPGNPKKNELWHDTNTHTVKKWDGNSWNTQTHKGSQAVGPSGGGGGGATDIRLNGEDLSDRIMVAGGSGGASGNWNKTGTGAWALHLVPATPAPPFGTDNTDSGATGTDHTWATAVNYFTGGWGGGGAGGANGPAPTSTPTPNGGLATSGGAGGPATGRHKDGLSVPSVATAAGGGGTPLDGGSRGVGHGTAGTRGVGGAGGYASGGNDDWCAGGGGGAGGYFGGGGGGQGFKTTGDSARLHGDYIGSRGGGGGGGSNYVGPQFSAPVFCGCARPPLGDGNSGTGANGKGGFARITYTQPPQVQWLDVPTALAGGQDFGATFVYTPAQTGGAAIAHYVTGTGTITDDFPTTTTQTVMVVDPTQTQFTRTFTAPAAGASLAIFVKAVDTDGDSSVWLKQSITGLNEAVVSPATITSPAANSLFIGSATVNWTVGSQTPLVAYRLGLTGSDLMTGVLRSAGRGMLRGGSRVNLALDPGFEGTSVWSSGDGNLAPSTDFPGVSGSCGKITWGTIVDGGAEAHTTVWDNLLPGMSYRLHIEVASNMANDPRLVSLQLRGGDGSLINTITDLSAQAAGEYLPLDIEFTPHTQQVGLVLVPSATGTDDTTDTFGNTDAGQITYLANMLIEPAYDDAINAPYFDGSHLNGNTGAVSWSGAANGSPSVLTGTDVDSDTLTYAGPPLLNGEVFLDTFTESAFMAGYGGAEATRPVMVNPSIPSTPAVMLEVNSAAGLITLVIDADDSANTTKTVSFDIFRDGVRIVTGLIPGQTTRQAIYDDTPATGVQATYLVRAFDSEGGYIGQSDGTVTITG